MPISARLKWKHWKNMVYQEISSKSPLTLSNTIFKKLSSHLILLQGFLWLTHQKAFFKLTKNIGLPGEKFLHF
jgi:hypothetical protein